MSDNKRIPLRGKIHHVARVLEEVQEVDESTNSVKTKPKWSGSYFYILLNQIFTVQTKKIVYLHAIIK